MTQTLLPCVEIEPKARATHAIICLHGLGADGHDLAALAPELDLASVVPVRWVLPHAPSISVTLNGGFLMPAWYDIRNLSPHRRDHDEAGIRKSEERVEALIAREVARGVPPAHIFLMGFSQGGAVALFTGLRLRERLGGLVGLSTYLTFDETLEGERSPANAGLPVFMAHGTLDPVVSFDGGLQTMERLKRLGHPVEWHTYPIEHAICAEEIDDLRKWYVDRFAATAR